MRKINVLASSVIASSIIYLILFLIVWLLMGCKTTETAVKNPVTDIVIVTNAGPVMISEGFLDDSDNYWTLEEWEALQQEYLQEQQRQLEEYLQENSEEKPEV